MEHKSCGSLYYVIPAEVMHDPKLDLYEKVLYSLIAGLTDKYGHCFASNEWFEEVLGIETRKIQRHLSILEENGYITREIESDAHNPFKKKRKIFVNTSFKKSLPDVCTDTLGNVPTDTSVMSPQSHIISEDKKLISKEEKSAAPPPSSVASDLCKFFIEKIKERNNNFKFTSQDKWITEFDAMLEHDKRTVDEIIILIGWVHTHSFWKANCLSPSSLRKHYDKMIMQMQAEAEQSRIEANRQFAIKLKKTYPDRTKDLTISPKYAMTLSSGKELPYDLPEETFKNTLCQMCGGYYEPNRPRSESSPVESESRNEVEGAS